jgi:hypothetical protein
LAPSQPPLNTITEKLNQSGEESDDDEDIGECAAGLSLASSEFDDDQNHDDAVTKSGYLWKKGERRKVCFINVIPTGILFCGLSISKR